MVDPSNEIKKWEAIGPQPFPGQPPSLEQLQRQQRREWRHRQQRLRLLRGRR